MILVIETRLPSGWLHLTARDFIEGTEGEALFRFKAEGTDWVSATEALQDVTGSTTAVHPGDW